MTNAEIIKDLGIELTGDAEKDNKIVNDTFGVGAPDKIVKYLKNGDNHKKITLSPISFEIGFCEQVWSKLDLPEKLKVMKWASEDYLQKNGYGTTFPPFEYFLKDNYDYLSIASLAFFDSIYLDLETFSEISGYEAATLIIHESIHEIDNIIADKIIYDEISDYIQNFEGVNNFRTVKSIIKLPINGKIINWKTGEYEHINEILQNKILLSKHMLIKCPFYSNTPNNRNEILTSNDFDKYISAAFYYSSPLENKAYNLSIKNVLEVAKRNEEHFIVTENDKKMLNKSLKFLLKINGRKREIQKQFKMPLKEAINMQFEYEFNKQAYGHRKRFYICKSNMQKREEIVNRFWNIKHVGKGGYKEGATEQQRM